MAHHIALFRFRLSGGHSIGPAALRRLWSVACESDEVNVSRVTSNSGFGDIGHTYSLCGPPRILNLAAIETRLRRMLTEKLPSATINLTCL